jgi:hypothetical protein
MEDTPMNRIDLENWFAQHPDAIGMNARMLLDDCEHEIRHHAHHDAWMHARDVATHSLHRFESVFGLPASDTFVTREVCHEIARELRAHEPHPEKINDSEWIRGEMLAALNPEGRSMLRAWLVELAEYEEHTAWVEIVRFTDHLAKKIIRDGHMTNDVEWDMKHSYPRVAARVAKMLIEEFESHAREEQRVMAPTPTNH